MRLRGLLKFRRERFPDSSHAFREHETFSKQARKSLDAHLLSKCNDIESKDDLIRFVKTEIERGVEAEKNWKLVRHRGPRFVGAALQSFGTKFSSFVESYSGVVEIVKTVGGQNADFAYSALSTLFIVSLMCFATDEEGYSYLIYRWQ